jgi:hypothetical protein
VTESRLRQSLRRQKAIKAAAVQYHGWGRNGGGYPINPEEHWEASTEDQRKACIELTTPVIEAYERVMNAPDQPAVDPDSSPFRVPEREKPW